MSAEVSDAAATAANSSIKKVALLFSGGPAPAANAVISTAAVSFLRNGVDVVGVKYGYSNLMQFGPDRPLVGGEDYIDITHKIIKRTRNSQGILVGTARANPGKFMMSPDDLKDPEKTAPLATCYEALCSIGVDALISIGGDDTLKTANKMKLYQDGLPADAKRIPVVHLPKTIDNDYMGIDFTFGFFTAADTLAAEVRNLLADGESSRSYFLCEVMGRSAGWLAYGAAIAGEASLVISTEDIVGKYATTEEFPDPNTGETKTRPVMRLDRVVDRMVATMIAREKEGKEYGVFVIAEGVAELLPFADLEGVDRDDHGHIAISQVQLGRRFSKWISKEYEKRTGRKRKITGLQLGYEARCARPNAFDVMLGSQLGVGAYRALIEQQLNGVMVSVKGQLELDYKPFESLVDPETLTTIVRHIDHGSDFHRLARFLETYI